MSDEASSSSKKSGKGSGNNNGNDSDSSLEISWSEQLKQDEERAKREAKQIKEFQCQVAAHMTRYYICNALNINCSTVHHKVTRFAFIRAYEVSKCVVEM